MKTETRLHTRIIAALEARGGHAIKLHGNQFQRIGEPDILYVEDGHAHFFEVKTTTGRLDPIQAHRLRQWADAGATVGVVRSPQEAIALVEGYQRTL